MNYGKYIRPSVPDIPLNMGNGRNYLAGIKQYVPDSISDIMPSSVTRADNNLIGDVVNFVIDNPVATLGGAALAGGGLYLARYRNMRRFANSPAAKYANIIKHSMNALATIIVGKGIMKRISQEPVETILLKHELKELMAQQKKAKPIVNKLCIPVVSVPLNKTTSMAKLFEN